MKKAEIILHPIRMRIIQTLIRGERMTAQALQQQLDDVPQATLYRHLKKLTDAGVLKVAEEIPVRGTLEKVYALSAGGAEISAEELRQASGEEHMALFMQFAANLISEYGRYVQSATPAAPDLEKDGVSLRQYSAWLTDEENLQLLRDIRSLLQKAMQNEPVEGRKRRLLAILDFPEP
jgi:predicted ArsR family transcriptional regulator